MTKCGYVVIFHNYTLNHGNLIEWSNMIQREPIMYLADNII